MGSDHANPLKNGNFPSQIGRYQALEADFYPKKQASKQFLIYAERVDWLRPAISLPKSAF
jgi:hypothetical protein